MKTNLISLDAALGPASVSPASATKSAWPKRVLLFAAAWNLFGGISALLQPGQHFASMYTSSLSMTDPLAGYFYQCVWVNVIA